MASVVADLEGFLLDLEGFLPPFEISGNLLKCSGGFRYGRIQWD